MAEDRTGLVTAAFVGTGLMMATSLLAAVAPDTFGAVHASLSFVMFVVGVASFLWAYGRGLSRSRSEVVSLSGLFFLAGSTAPTGVRHRLRGALAIEVVAALIAASVRPYTVVAFGILAPMYAMGLMAAWGGVHGQFSARPPR